ncbi:4'-phosphopantetheinyl transferase [Kitasatospora sp. NPDC059463]|uniref:4'-phosphopantetheinyl transferase family protein n=1 Tax=unclassified Kitasatospora TaxID=2633591 RepID=UPI00368B7B31
MEADTALTEQAPAASAPDAASAPGAVSALESAVARHGGPPAGTALAFAHAGADRTPAPHPAEEDLLRRLPATRHADFRLGRAAAARCLAGLGVPGPVLAEGRLPLFPDGVAGSISHRAGVGVCLAAPRSLARAVGVDLELLDALPLRAARLVCTERERAWLEPGPDPVARLGTLFSLKESIYKAVCSRGVAISGFQQIELPPEACGDLPGPAATVLVAGVLLETGLLRSGRSVLTWAVVRP